MARIATRPLNRRATRRANDDFYRAHPELVQDGKRIPLDPCNSDHDHLRAEWMDAYERHGGATRRGRYAPVCCDPTEPCPRRRDCNPGSVTLDVDKQVLALKQDRETKLEVKVSRASATVDSYRIEMKRQSGGGWCTISNKQEEDPWKAKIAGKFKLRGVATVCGTEYKTGEEDLEVRFPSYAEISGDAGVVAQTDAEWQNTLADCTSAPNRRRERGFWIKLNTETDAYEFDATVTGSWRGPTQGASVPLPSRPADSPASPGACDDGATYYVASFHTHTPTAFRAAANPPGATRSVGPSGADQNIDNADYVPGLVYDYVESPAGSGSIPMGHPENGAAQLYHSQGRNRRTTPP